MVTPETKAAGFNSAIATLRTMVPEEDFRRFVAGLPRPCAEIIERPPLAMTWIPMTLTTEVFVHIQRDLFGGSPDRMFELGRKQFLADMSSIYKVFLRVASPAFVATKAAAIYDTYGRGGGKMTVSRREENALEILVDGHPHPSVGIWAFLRGTIHAVIELTGVKGPKVRIVEGGGTQPRCLFRVTWE